jgi:hypothetical protein
MLSSAFAVCEGPPNAKDRRTLAKVGWLVQNAWVMQIQPWLHYAVAANGFRIPEAL